MDKKTPLLRSIDALSKQAMRILRLFGTDGGVSRVMTTIGPEQEYFVVDEGLCQRRPDLVACNRTLFGAPAPKHQQLSDHYFGCIPERVRAFMAEVEDTLYRLGVPVKTRHNEVAPGQYEIAPLFEEANVGCDHQMIVMETLSRIAPRHGLQALLHEKPFAGINGSGKHNNWSMCTDAGVNLLNPTSDAHTNAVPRFPVRRYRGGGPAGRPAAGLGGVVRKRSPSGRTRSPAGHHVDLPGRNADRHRRPARERHAEPDALARGAEPRAGTLPQLPRPQSHVALCIHRQQVRVPRGWRFDDLCVAEYGHQHDCGRKPGSDRQRHRGGATGNRSREAVEAAVGKVLQRVIRAHKRVLFDGDNYSDAWQAEAARRGLPNVNCSAEALRAFADASAAELFARYQVLSEAELSARARTLAAKYATEVRIEAEAMASIARTTIAPACVLYQGKLAAAVAACKNAGVQATRQETCLHDLDVLINEFLRVTDRLQMLIGNESLDDPMEDARFAANGLKPVMAELREFGDRLEGIVDSSAWPLPTYRELLFVR